MKVLDANLKTKIISHIKDNGPINLSSFMEMCLHDKQFGYYSNSNVIGKNGDFITAPEVSQVFGELIAANIIDNQIKSNFFKANIVDLGPGKGTLISDILSTIKKLKKSNYYLNPILYEKSDILRQIQKNKLKINNCSWIKNINEINELPTYFIANEFFDALPIDQYVSQNGRWHQRNINFKHNNFYFEVGEQIKSQPNTDPKPDGRILEDGLTAKIYIEKICKIILKNSGAIIIIDYGQVDKKFKERNTVQGVLNNKKSPIFENLGFTDLSSWINFTDIINRIPKGLVYQGPITQKKFLLNLGIKERFENLSKDKSPIEKRQLISDFERLISSSFMGQAFKVLIIRSEKLSPFLGF